MFAFGPCFSEIWVPKWRRFGWIWDLKMEEKTVLVRRQHFPCFRYRFFIVVQDVFEMKSRTLQAVSDVRFDVCVQRAESSKLL